MILGGLDTAMTAQSPLFHTGSFSGYYSTPGAAAAPLSLARYGYMTAEPYRRQPLCGNKEGWGPLSPHRYDFTPCFMDVWVAAVAAFGVLGGAIAITWLVRSKRKYEMGGVGRGFVFWAKMVGCDGSPNLGSFGRNVIC